MQRLEVSCAVRHIYIYVVSRLRVNYTNNDFPFSNDQAKITRNLVVVVVVVVVGAYVLLNTISTMLYHYYS
jgi:hypothetical protein